MNIAHFTVSLPVATAFPWYADWVLSLLLIVFTALIHLLGLPLINKNVVRLQDRVAQHRRYPVGFVLIIGFTALLALFCTGRRHCSGPPLTALSVLFQINSSAVLYSLTNTSSVLVPDAAGQS